MAGLRDSRPIAVPGSWNDQFEDDRDFLGPAWYQTNFFIPDDWMEQRVVLRFNSVNYLADIWLNGEKLGLMKAGISPSSSN